MDDTLYPEYAYAVSGLKAVGQSLEEQCPGITQAFLACLARGVRGTVFNEVLPQFQLSLSLIPRLVTQYREHLPLIDFYPDALASLQWARSIGRVGLISDGPLVCQQRKVDALGLDAHMDLIVLTDEAGKANWKPSIYAFEKMMKHFQVSGQACLYVGDNPDKDFLAPNRLGWTTVQIVRADAFHKRKVPEPAYRAQHEIKELSELASLWPLSNRN